MSVFLTAVRTLNFTSAARQLHMTQPGVSQHIQALEQHFDMPLFVRSGRNVQLSDACERVLPLAEQMVAQSQGIENQMEALKGNIFGHLTIGCSTTLGKYVLPILLSKFMESYPNVQTSCIVFPRETTLQKLSDGEINIALSSERTEFSNLTFERFITDKIMLIAPPDHPWALRESIEPKELLGERFIWREEGSGTRQVVDHALREFGIGIEDLHTVLTLGNSEAIALAVQEGIGLGFVSQIIVSRLVGEQVAAITVRGLDISQNIYIGCRNDTVGSVVQNEFWEYATDPRNPVLRRIHYSKNSHKDGITFSSVSAVEEFI
jgi:DNA-binding transcriptional LysR family regulator